MVPGSFRTHRETLLDTSSCVSLLQIAMAAKGLAQTPDRFLEEKATAPAVARTGTSSGSESCGCDTPAAGFVVAWLYLS